VTYLALAQERFMDAGGDGALAPADRHFELFGIAPTCSRDGSIADAMVDDRSCPRS
jgi:hypothetical protein